MKELLCEKCQNKDICKYREEYEQVHTAVTSTSIHRSLDDGRRSIRNVVDVPWVVIRVECKYYRGVAYERTIDTAVKPIL